mmetsp:Transcript_20727/g.39469  ORF Transcript_20727/g.39469 Transcript_20727/m.39469 type:complete len:452 (-) Transcript_20727:11-1366(-)
MGMPGPAVEVRKNPKSTTWYNATILDVKEDHITVGFEDNIWASRDVLAYSVRCCPPVTDDDDFDPKVDEVVEVSVSASDTNPSGWSLGKVKNIRNSFYFIGFASTKGSQDLIVERHALRRVNNQPTIDTQKLERRVISVEAALYPWITSQDALGCLSHLQTTARLLLAACNTTGHEGAEVLLVGETRAVDLAEKLLKHIHFRNQLEMLRFEKQREELLGRLKDWEQWYSERNQEVFTVDSTIVGKIIGKKGESINAIREKHSVEVHFEDDHEGGTTVTITGPTDEAVQSAREEIEYVSVEMPIDASQVGWILGKGYSNIQEISKMAGLHSARYNDMTSSLELVGLKAAVEEAKVLVNTHAAYFGTYKEMSEEKDQIQMSFDKLEGAGKKGGGRKGGRGGWKGGGDKGDEFNEQEFNAEESYPSLSAGSKGNKGSKGAGRGGRGRKGWNDHR